MTYPEENRPDEDVEFDTDIRQFGVRDWADTIIDELGEGRSSSDRILEDATWSTQDGGLSYELKRVDVYDHPSTPPTRTYFLKVYKVSDSKNFEGFIYDSTKRYARKCDMARKIVKDGRRRREHHEEMLQHLQTAPIEPSEFYSAPTRLYPILQEIRKRDFTRRYRAGQFVARNLSKVFRAQE